MSPSAWVLDSVNRGRRATRRRSARQTREALGAHEAAHALLDHRSGRRIRRAYVSGHVALDEREWGGVELEGYDDRVTADRVIALCREFERDFGPAPEADRPALAGVVESFIAGAVGESVALSEQHLGGNLPELCDRECAALAGAVYGSANAEEALSWHALQVALLVLEHRAAWDALRRELIAELELPGTRAHAILEAQGAAFGGYSTTPWRAAA